MKEPGIALVGAGYWGNNILRTLRSMGHLTLVCETSEKLKMQREKEYQDVKFTSSITDILADDSIKGVVIATPAITHHDVALSCLKSGKDVFVEKPITLDVRHANDLISFSEKHNLVLMVGHILQYHPAVVKLKDILKSGEIGELCYIYSHRLSYGKIRTEENVLWSFAPHDISMILSLMGSEPVKISAKGSSFIQPGIKDVARIDFEFKKGASGHIFVSWLNPFKEQKLTVIGTKGMAVFNDTSEDKLTVTPVKIEIQNGTPVAIKQESRKIELGECDPLKSEFLHFIECIQTRKTPLTDGREGLRVLKFLQKADKTIK